MNNDVRAKDYFLSQRPEQYPLRKIYSRIANAMVYCGDLSMKELCEMPEQKLKRLRNIGPSARKVIYEECRTFMAEQKSANKTSHGN